MTFEGIRDDGAPGAPYFRTLPRFENRLLAVGTGGIGADGQVQGQAGAMSSQKPP